MHPDDLDQLPVGAETDDRRHRQLDRQRELDATMDAEKQAQMLKERYGRNRAAAADALVVPKRLLLPSVEDPSIWGCRCKPGKEREVVYAIRKRMEERPAGSRDPLRIISVFERANVTQGYFYVEARRQADVSEGIERIQHVYANQRMILIPVKEMPALLRVNKSEELNPGGWVRIKRGKYQGDLAQIEEVETNGLTVTLRLVPRLDYGMNDDSLAVSTAADTKRKRAPKSGVRPPQRLFSEAEAKKKHSKYLSSTSGLGGKSWNYHGENYVDGFLIKDMKLNFLITKNVNPRLEEVTMFARGGEYGTANLDLASLADTLKNSTAEEAYQPGDPVEVYRGEQQGLIGRTVSTKGEIVSLEVTEGDLLGQTVDAPVRTLRKRFREGDHVKVIGGSRYHHELGMVVQVKDDTVTLISDMSKQEITVFSRDLRLSSEMAADGHLGIYDVHDLVQLDAATVACVIKVDRESLRVVDQNGSVRNILPSQVANIIHPRRDAVATDRNGAEIRYRDTVREVYGEQRTGRILHIYRSFLFLHNKAEAENAGISVVRTTNVVTISARGGRPTGPDLTKMNPAMARQVPLQSQSQVETRQRFEETTQRGGTMPPPPRGRDKLLGKTVQVRNGRHKGLYGIVRDADERHATVELYTSNKPVQLPRDSLAPKELVPVVIKLERDPNPVVLKLEHGKDYRVAQLLEGGKMLTIPSPVTKASLDLGRGIGRGGSRTPSWSAAPPRDAWQGSRTPMGAAASSRTPAWGAPTSARSKFAIMKSIDEDANINTAPAWSGMSGSRTPAWNAEGSRTSNPYDGSRTAYGDGSRTAYGGGNRTPAWNSGSRTPYDSSSGYDAFASGSRTPAWGAANAGNRTPAWGTVSNSRDYDDAQTPGDGFSAPTPGAYGAPTPGATAPTPGAWADSAPTPGAFNAPTPGGLPKQGGYDAPTPAAYDAPTPAMGGTAATPGAGYGDDDGGPAYDEGSP